MILQTNFVDFFQNQNWTLVLKSAFTLPIPFFQPTDLMKILKLYLLKTYYGKTEFLDENTWLEKTEKRDFHFWNQGYSNATYLQYY